MLEHREAYYYPPQIEWIFKANTDIALVDVYWTLEDANKKAKSMAKMFAGVDELDEEYYSDSDDSVHAKKRKRKKK